MHLQHYNFQHILLNINWILLTHFKLPKYKVSLLIFVIWTLTLACLQLCLRLLLGHLMWNVFKRLSFCCIDFQEFWNFASVLTGLLWWQSKSTSCRLHKRVLVFFCFNKATETESKTKKTKIGQQRFLWFKANERYRLVRGKGRKLFYWL